MADTRAITRILNRVKQLEVYASKNLSNEPLESIKANLLLLKEEWADYKASSHLYSDAPEIINLQDQLEARFFSVKGKLITAELSLSNALHPPELDSSLSELMANQRSFLQEVSNINSKSENEVRLPRVNIPFFTGIYSEFASFRDLFEASIHNNGKMSKVHKLQYLKGLLKGEAYALIRHVAITDANYEEAWQMIVHRYDKKKHVITTLLKQFMEQPIINQVSAKSLHHMHDVSDEVLRGIKVLGEDYQSRDPWLIYILISKLEQNLKQAWAKHSYGIESPKIEQFFEFLRQQGDTLECCEPLKRNTQRQSQGNNIKVMHTGTNIICCPKCSSEHYLRNCDEFLQLSVHERRGFVADKKLCFICLFKNHQSQNCRSRFRCGICRARHHSTLHEEKPTVSNSSAITNITFNPEISETSNQNLETRNVAHAMSIKRFTAILPTAVIRVLDSAHHYQRCRALLDSGAQSSFISEACAQRLGLARMQANFLIKGVTSGTEVTRGRLLIDATSIYSTKESLKVDVLILKKLTDCLPTRELNTSDLERIKGLELADPEFYKPEGIDIIIGADKFFNILRDGQINNLGDSLIAQNTMFGWIISGEMNEDNDKKQLTRCNYHIDLNINETLQKFWEMEELPSVKPFSDEENKCEEHYRTNFTRHISGKFIVKLPFKNSERPLGNSLNITRKRLCNLQQRLNRDVQLKNEYIKVMREYIALGHMREIPEQEKELQDDKCYYLPHHSVIKMESSTTKVRVVFDGSSKTTNRNSINDVLMNGPNIQPPLWNTLNKFRHNQFAFTADIEKMYRQILVADQDQDFQRVLWREHVNEPIKYYKLTTVTFGMGSSSFLATRSLLQAAYDCAEEYPDISKEISSKFYIDDYLSGASTIEDARYVKEKITLLLAQKGFRLRKWHSNAIELSEPVTANDKSLVSIDETDSTVKILGLQWNALKDYFTFKVNLPLEETETKRTLISNASKVFDPLGLVAPSIILAKILYQRLWLRNLDWDDRLPDDIAILWNQVKMELHQLENLRIRRFIGHRELQIHGFSDASERAYAAVVYGRFKNEEGLIQVELIASKTKVAPIKQISLPRLELCGAHLLAKLMTEVQKTFEQEIEMHAWTDSTIVLSWLSDHPTKWKTFVANRVSEVQQLLPRNHWQHVKSGDNPADYASRGVLPSRLLKLDQWWHGPAWLCEIETKWPTIEKEVFYEETLCEIKEKSCSSNIPLYHVKELENSNVGKGEVYEILLNKVSSFSKIIRILCFVNKFINIVTKRSNNKTQGLSISAIEMNEATERLVKWVQQMIYSNEINALKRNKELPKHNKLSTLTPFIDEKGILRVRGRLHHSNYPYEAKHPIILPKSHILSRMIISFYHKKYLHPGPSHTFHLIRQSYWIVHGRGKVREEVKKCIQCFKNRATVSSQIMGNLPAVRITPARPFSNCGVDYAGPILLASKRGRGAKLVKGYIAVFVCMVTKAVHIETVTDLTTNAFIATLKRFAARRGVPSNIYSDNGTNFVGANKLLKEVYQFHSIKNNDFIITEYCSQNQIRWHHIPPSAPHFGGLWESAIKSVKTHLYRVTGNSHLTFEEMTTLLCQIEGVLNSRPLCPISDDDSFEALTPAHFLTGSSLNSIPERDMSYTSKAILSRWQQVQQLVQTFWKRFHKDYINNLQQRNKWKSSEDNLKINDLVLIKDENLPTCKWAMGRIIQIHPDDKGSVRVVTIKTSNNILKRSITKICKLPIE